MQSSNCKKYVYFMYRKCIQKYQKYNINMRAQTYAYVYVHIYYMCTYIIYHPHRYIYIHI